VDGSAVPPELAAAIREGSIEGRLSCAVAWRLADGIGIRRLEIGQACETLGIKIHTCQLGAF
jgi:hypothetical protein